MRSRVSKLLKLWLCCLFLFSQGAEAAEPKALSELSDTELVELKAKLELYIETLQFIAEQNDKMLDLKEGRPVSPQFNLQKWAGQLSQAVKSGNKIVDNIRRSEATTINSQKDVFLRAWEEILKSLDLIQKELSESKNLNADHHASPRALLEITSVHLALLSSYFTYQIQNPEYQRAAYEWALEVEELRKQINPDIGFLSDPIEAPLHELNIRDKEKNIHSSLFALASVGGIEVIRRVFRLQAAKDFKEKIQSSPRFKNCCHLVKKLDQFRKTHRRKTKLLFIVGFGGLGFYFGYLNAIAREQKENIEYELDPDTRTLMSIEVFHQQDRKNISIITETYSSIQNNWKNQLSREWTALIQSPAKQGEKRVLEKWQNLDTARKIHHEQLRKVELEITARDLNN